MDQQVYAMKIADIFSPEVKRRILNSVNKKLKSIFPSPDTLYQKDIVKKNEVNFTPLQIQTAINANTINLNNTNSINNNISNNNSSNLNTNNSNNTNNSSTKKKYEEDVHTPIKSKKHSVHNSHSKYQYREKTLTSNSDLFTNYSPKKIEEDFDKVKYDKIQINENDINNSNETTSISSKDEINPNNNLLRININNININEAKKEEKEENDYIDIMKFNSQSDLSNSKNSSEKKSNNNTNDKFGNKLFTQRESSRFNFIRNNRENTEGVNVPNFVFEIIKKKISRQKFTKNINFEEDILYKDSILERELDNSDQWAHYIYDEKHIDSDKDLLYDFDTINRSIKDKFTTFYIK